MANGGIHFEGRQALDFIGALKTTTPVAIAEGLNILADATQKHARANHPRYKLLFQGKRYADRTGNLTNSIIVKPATVRHLESEARTGLSYSAIVEEGHTTIYDIKPRVKKILAWKNAFGKWVVARKVTRKGQRPHPFMGPAHEAVKPTHEKVMAKAMDKAMEKALAVSHG